MLTKDDLTPELLQKEFDSGLWHIEIGKKYNVSSRTIYEYVKKWNLNVPRKNKKKEIVKFVCKDCGKEFTKLEPEGICWKCKQKRDALSNEMPVDGTSNSKYLKDVLELRAKGFSYKQIAEELGCNKSTVSYLLSNKTREELKARVENLKEQEYWKYELLKQLSDFKRRVKGSGRALMSKDWNKKLRTSVSRFKLSIPTELMKNYGYKEVLEHFGGTTVTCELTGRTIDLTKDDYNIDHIIPVARGGSNELENMAFTIPDANAAKHEMTNEEFVALCKEICEHFGYTVIKKE